MVRLIRKSLQHNCNCSYAAVHQFAKIALLNIVLLSLFIIPDYAQATIFFFNDFEGKTCNTTINDAEMIEGFMWDDEVGAPRAYSRCSVPSPSGNNYVEWQTVTGTHDCITYLATRPANLNFGTTYYLAGFFKFGRINGNDIWKDTGPEPYQFDKLIEFRSSGFRWGIGAGWNGWYNNGTDHKFTFDAWYATSVLGERGPDHIVADQTPYGPSNPYLCDYEKWYGVVLAVTANNSSAGRVQLWINGTKIIDQAHYTANSGATIAEVILNGTIAQPSYDAPPHNRSMDRIIVTDNWQDIINGGFLSGVTSSPAGTSLSAPGNLRLSPTP